ncbi:MAG: JAB domain-containing protein [Tenacibaculum sp.]
MKITEIQVSYTNPNSQRLKITGSKSSYDFFMSCWNMDTIELQEEVKAMLLNRANQILGVYSLSKGGVSSAYIDPKLLFSVALKSNASNIILAHNHPSGNLKPSNTDMQITAKLKKAGRYLDINLLDHLIITKDDYYSLSDNGDM